MVEEQQQVGRCDREVVAAGARLHLAGAMEGGEEHSTKVVAEEVVAHWTKVALEAAEGCWTLAVVEVVEGRWSLEEAMVVEVEH